MGDLAAAAVAVLAAAVAVIAAAVAVLAAAAEDPLLKQDPGRFVIPGVPRVPSSCAPEVRRCP